MNAPELDSERLTFLRALDAAEDIEVTDWEAGFIASAFKFSSTSPAFSEGQRVAIDRMWCRYGPHLKIANRKSQIANLNLPETVPGKCAWLVGHPDDPHRRLRCGQPVAEGKNFCAAHQAERERVAAQLRDANRRKLRS